MSSNRKGKMWSVRGKYRATGKNSLDAPTTELIIGCSILAILSFNSPTKVVFRHITMSFAHHKSALSVVGFILLFNFETKNRQEPKMFFLYHRTFYQTKKFSTRSVCPNPKKREGLRATKQVWHIAIRKRSVWTNPVDKCHARLKKANKHRHGFN